jgi:hypothetical protein
MNNSNTTLTKDPQIESLLLPLTATQQRKLEEEIKQDGCREPLLVWKEKNILVDGHHRYQICEKHNIEYQVEEKSFDSYEEVKLWIIDHQWARRQTSPKSKQMAYSRGLYYDLQKGNQGAPKGNKNRQKQSCQNDNFEDSKGTKTINRVAKHFGVSSSKINRDHQLYLALLTIEKAINQEARIALTSEDSALESLLKADDISTLSQICELNHQLGNQAFEKLKQLAESNQEEENTQSLKGQIAETLTDFAQEVVKIVEKTDHSPRDKRKQAFDELKRFLGQNSELRDQNQDFSSTTTPSEPNPSIDNQTLSSQNTGSPDEELQSQDHFTSASPTSERESHSAESSSSSPSHSSDQQSSATDSSASSEEEDLASSSLPSPSPSEFQFLENNELTTLETIREMAEATLERIDLEPSSVQETWEGNVFLALCSDDSLKWMNKLLSELDSENTKSAIVLTVCDSRTEWFTKAMDQASAIGLLSHNIQDGKGHAEAKLPMMLWYFGKNIDLFKESLNNKRLGWALTPSKQSTFTRRRLYQSQVRYSNQESDVRSRLANLRQT